MKKIERIAALEAQLTKALTDMAALQCRVSILESKEKWVPSKPVTAPYTPLHPPSYTPAPPFFRPWEVTCEAAQ